MAALASTVCVAVCAEVSMAQRAPFGNLQLRRAIGGNLGAADKQMLDTYFDKYFFKHFMEPEGPDVLPNLRGHYRTLVRNIEKTPAHDYVNKLVYDRCLGMVGQKKYDTAIRYNAMLLIAELNEDDRTLKPLPAAFDIIKKVAMMKNRPELDFLTPAALVGLARVAEDGQIPTDQAAEVARAMYALLTQEDPPPYRDAAVHDYLRRSAAQVLARMGNPGQDNAVAKAFEAMLTDPQASVVTRCEMVRYLGMLKYPAAAQADIERLAKLLGRQAAEICDAEVGGKDNKKVASRQTIMYALDSSESGLAGLYSSAESGSDVRTLIRELRDVIRPLLRTLSDLDETKESQVATIVGPEIDKLKQLLAERGVAKGVGGGPLVAAGGN